MDIGGKGNDTLLVETGIGGKGKGLLSVETGIVLIFFLIVYFGLICLFGCSIYFAKTRYCFR
jgi:hypothetical protein